LRLPFSPLGSFYPFAGCFFLGPFCESLAYYSLRTILLPGSDPHRLLKVCQLIWDIQCTRSSDLIAFKDFLLFLVFVPFQLCVLSFGLLILSGL
jgi:hypothetical protein